MHSPKLNTTQGLTPGEGAWQHTTGILAWRISMDGEPGGLHSMGWQRDPTGLNNLASMQAGSKQLVVWGCLGMESYKEVVMKCPHQIQRRRDELIGEDKEKEKRVCRPRGRL